MNKPHGYYSHVRWDVLPFIPDDASAILSLGCGTAATEKKFRLSRSCHIVGVEINKAAADTAKDFLDEVIVDSIDNALPKLKNRKFDCILLLDVLEHLADPWKTLSACSDLLADGGVVISSIPNVNHRSIRGKLQLDIFPYTSAGILDISHFRFFTLTEIYKLFASADLKIIQTNNFKSRIDPVQYIVKAKKIPLPSPSIVSTIIIPVLNNLGLTKNCINSIRENTAAPYRLVVVDNGSTDGTRAWLKQQPDILHILNSTNLGFGPAINEGFFCSKTPTFIVLNNDTLVAKNWLTNMLAHLSHDPSVGIVGPMSNFVSGPQLLPDSDRLSPDSFFSHAASVFSERQGLSKVVGRLVFFCALIKKDVVDKIGGIDERFIIGNFEDDDFCRRALSAGFKCLIAQDTLVYHFGHATFKANNIDLNKLLAVNRKTYNSKWEAPK